MPTDVSETVEFTLEDLERLDDRLAHAEQYLKEAQEAIHECHDLVAKIDEPLEDEAGRAT
jgi:hypothetical protein